MLSSALRKGRFHRPALALAVSIIAAACSDGGENQSKTASAPPPSAPAVAEKAAGSSTEAPRADAADAAPTPAKAPAMELAAATPAEPAHDESKPHPHVADPAAKPPAEAAKPAFGSALGSSASAATADAKAALSKAEAAAAQKIGDPLGEETDPNSKAKLTYEFGTENKIFGKCMQGDILSHAFQLKSEGEDDLVIKQAKPTCGCTLAQVAVQQADGSMAAYNFGSPIPPGRKIELSATLHTQGKRGHAASRINIFSNDPRGQTQLGLEAEVDPFFQVNPMNLNFNTISARDTVSDKVTIATTRGEKVKLLSPLDNLPQGMKIEVKPIDPDAEGKSARWELAASLGPSLVEGSLAYTVGLKSDIEIPGGEKLPSGSLPTYEVSIPVMARVTGMISYAPAFVSLGLIRPGQVVSRSVRITSHDPEFKLPEPKVTVVGRGGGEWEFANRFSSVVRPVTGENAIDIELRLDGMPDTLSGSFSGELEIQVGHPEKPLIKLPITGVCRGAPNPAPPVDPGSTTPPK